MKSVILLIILISGTASALPHSEGEEWRIMQEITLQEISGEDLSDIQILLTPDSDSIDYSLAHTDGADIRFTDENGETLPYWVENWDPSGKTTKIWVRIPSLEADGQSKVRIFYNNPAATDFSDGRSTFYLYEDFDDLVPGETPEGWKVKGYGSFTANETYSVSAPNSGAMTDIGECDALEIRKTFTEQSSLIAELDILPSNISQIVMIKQAESFPWVNASMLRFQAHGILTWSDSMNPPSDHEVMHYTQKWYRIQETLRPDSYDIYVDNVPDVSGAEYLDKPSGFECLHFVGPGSYPGTVYVDNIRIRSYLPEPPEVTYSESVLLNQPDRDKNPTLVVKKVVTYSDAASPNSLSERVHIENLGKGDAHNISISNPFPTGAEVPEGQPCNVPETLRAGESCEIRYGVNITGSKIPEIHPASVVYTDDEGVWYTASSDAGASGRSQNLPGSGFFICITGCIMAFVIRRKL